MFGSSPAVKYNTNDVIQRDNDTVAMVTTRCAVAMVTKHCFHFSGNVALVTVASIVIIGLL